MRNAVEEKGMTHSIEITSRDIQTPLLSQTQKDEIKEGREMDHLIDINGQDLSGSQTKKSLNQIFDKKFENLDNSIHESCTIFKVNAWLRESNPDAYTPKMISIGPYHNKNPQLDPMEKYKLLYLRQFLHRKEELDVESCISKLEELKKEALECYDDVNTDEFCQMLLLDGCFVVEFIRECFGIRPIGEDKTIMINPNEIFLDLILLENQLPFFVLNQLHAMTKRDGELPLATLVGVSFPSFVDLPELTSEFFKETAESDIKHLLHLVHKLLCHGNRKKISKEDEKWHMVMPNATELFETGVRFEKNSIATSLFDVKFEKGLMKIPSFGIFNYTETLLRNLIAYEQQSWDVYPTYFSDFAIFMDSLIESDKDVTLLRRKGIIMNFIGEDKQVANLFNKMGTGVTTSPDFYYNEEFGKATEHYKNPRIKIKVNFLQYYFSSPWVTASTFAAVILLILTAIQTILAFIK